MKTKSYAALEENKPLEFYEFQRREPAELDVEIKIHYSGVCHSDIHKTRGDWGSIEYPYVPGHEIIGEVTRVGSGVSSHEAGDIVGVGVLVGSCGDCQQCAKGEETYCRKGKVATYGSVDPIDGSMTKGGYADLIVVTEKFAIPIPEGLDLSRSAPLLCAGITMYSPLKRWKVTAGSVVAIAGLGGLGHMGVKYAKAMGAEVWVITTSPKKAKDAEKYGAEGVIVSTDEKQMSEAEGKFDLIIDTVPVRHDLNPYIGLLDVDGVICTVGAFTDMPEYSGSALIAGRKSITGSLVGGIPETMEMLNFSLEHNIPPEVEEIVIEGVNEAWDDVVNKGKSHRYVINMKESFK